MTAKEYIRQQAKECECGIRKYKDDMKYNFVIYNNDCFENHRGVVGFSQDYYKSDYRNVPIVFGGIEDLINDTCDKSDIVMTEEYYVNNLMDLEKMPYYLDEDLVEKEFNEKKYQILKAEEKYWDLG